MATINFFTRTITKSKNALVPVYVRIVSGRAVDLTVKTDILVKPESWSNETQQARQRAEIFKYYGAGEQETGQTKFNRKINDLRLTIEAAVMQASQSDLSAAWLTDLIDRYWHPEKYTINLFSYIEQFIKRSETTPNPKTGRPVSYKMRREYEATFQHLKNFCTSDYWKQSRPVDFKDIDLNFYNQFTAYLQSKDLAANTVGKKIQTLKIFLNSAKEEGLNPYETYKSRKFVAISEDADTVALNESELSALYKLDLSERPRLDRVRDMFLLGCWTGVSGNLQCTKNGK